MRDTAIRMFFITSMTHIFITTIAFSIPSTVQSDLSNKLFLDNFNGTELNSGLWEAPTFKLESCTYQGGNAVVEHNYLNLKSRKLNNSEFPPDYSCVQVQSREPFPYDEIEWRASVPHGKGLWSTLWLLPLNCMKVMHCKEPQFMARMNIDTAPTEYINVEIKWQNSSADGITTSTAMKKLKEVSGFHLFKLVRSPNEFTWYIDDEPVFMVADHFNTSSVPMKVIMDLKVDEAWRSSSNQDSAFPMEFRIDYILARMTRNAANPTTINPLRVIDAPTENKMVWIYILTSSGGTVVTVLLILMIIFYIRRKTQRSQISQIHSPDPVQFIGPNFSHCYQFHSKTDARQITDVNSSFKFLEISPRQLERTSEILGKGQFGTVSKGFLSDKKGRKRHEKTVVAVKIFQNCDSCNEDLQKKMFIEEIKIMLKVGRHLNIVNLMGFITVGEPILMVLEYCSNGSLLSYLHAMRSSFISHVDGDGNIIGSQITSSATGSVYLSDKATSLLSSGHTATQLSTSPQLSTDDLVRIAYQIARGLEYLASRSIIHRDLAARNVLVCENNIVKICDFGLARERILADYILQNDQVALPIKWMAPESLLERTFSYESDVWSFGVLLWELFSLGETPFTSTIGSGFNGMILEFAHAITNGLRMKRPIHSPLSIYGIMLQCWNIDKDSRPNASVLTYTFSTYLTDESTNGYLLLDEPYQVYNSTYAEFINSSLITQIPSEKHTALECASERD